MLTALALMAAILLVAISVDVGLPGQELLSSLRFHIGGALLVLPLLLALAGARFRSIITLGLVLASLGQGAATVLGQQERRSAVADEVALASFTALSFNVLNQNPRGRDAAAYIVNSGADVVAIMEARGVAVGMSAIEASYPYRLGCENLAQNCDLVILSKTPFIGSQKHQLDGLARWRLYEATTVIDGQSVTVVAMHLSKPYFDDVAKLELAGARNVIGKIAGPVLLMGDFNAAAWSNDVDAFAAGLELAPPPAYPATWPVELAPFGVPIDNMFTRGPAMIRQIETTPGAFGSNHLGLRARVELF